MKLYFVYDKENNLQGVFLVENSANTHVEILKRKGILAFVTEKRTETDIPEGTNFLVGIPDFRDFCIQQIKDNIFAYIDCDVCDNLGYELTSYMNANGTFTYSTFIAKKYLQIWDKEAGCFFEYANENICGSSPLNPFEEPETFITCMVVEGVRDIIDSIVYDLDFQESNLTKEMADEIFKVLDDYTISWL